MTRRVILSETKDLLSPDRRRFLQYLAGSPLLAAASGNISSLAQAMTLLQEPALIGSPREALNVFDFEPVAKKNVPIAHWGYLMTGTDDDGTIRANREGFNRFELRMRRLVDVSKVDASVTMIGSTWPTPIVINPVGSQKAFHREGEIATARAAKARDHLMVLSTVATTSIEDAIAARGKPIWFQLYHRTDWSQTREMLRRAERAGAPAVAFTVDLLGGSNRETMIREGRMDTRVCTNCHVGGQPLPGQLGVDLRDNRRKPALSGFGPGTPTETGTPTWDYVKRIKDATTMKVFLKGIVTREDAELAAQSGVDGLFVSNHGGRAENSLRATITCLPEVVAGFGGRGPVICDGGFRRGTDIFKAMAMGASSIGIGRPYIWGLGAFGQEGVEVVLELLRKEFELVMRQAGTTSVAKITRDYVVARG